MAQYLRLCLRNQKGQTLLTGYRTMRNFLRFLKEVRTYWRLLCIIACLTLVTSAASLPPPYLIKILTDSLLPSAIQQHKPTHLPQIFLAYVLLASLGALAGYWLTYSITLLGQRFKMDMRRKLYAHMQTLSLGFFEKSQTGKLMSNITNDVATLDQLISGGFVNVLQDSVTLIAVLFLLFHLDWKLALAALSVYPVYVLNYLVFIGRIKNTSADVREQREIIYGDLQEKLAGVQVVKSYARERSEVRAFSGETRSLLSLNVRANTLSTALWTLAEFIGAIGTAILLWYGGMQVMRGQETVGTLMAFYGYIGGYLYQPTLRMIQLNDQIARTNAALWRIFLTLDTQPTVSDTPQAKPLPTIQGNVSYNDVWFEYQQGQPVIKGVNLKVKAGEMIALVGPSGSGKTTMVNLLQRHYDVTEGSICIDGHDLRAITLSSLRRQVGVVIQETMLFNTTIRENLRYGRLDATDEEIEEAAAIANIAHVIQAMPRGYNTRLGEDGVKLSGGEKQRIAIARAVLANPRILILDEATSALDSETEALIQEALDRLMAGRTSFVIAHRLSTIVKADKIVVMERGMIRETGSHAELLTQGGIYAELYNQQFKAALEAQHEAAAVQAAEAG